MLCFYDADEEYSKHDLAWFSRDWDAVQKLADEFKEKPENEFFEIMNNINYNKQRMNVDVMDSYSKFAIDNLLSKSTDAIEAAYYANLFLHQMDDQSHHNYLCMAVPQGKRYPKGAKLDESYKDKFIIELLMKYYKVNSNKAFEYRILLAKKGKLEIVLKKAKGLVSDEFIKSITKNVKEQKELKKLL